MPETRLSPALTLPDRATFGIVTYPPGASYGPRLQRDCQLFVMVDGSATVRIDRSAEIAVGPGEGLLLLPGRREHFAFSAAGTTRHGWCHLEFGAGPPPLDGLVGRTTEAWTINPAVASLLEIGIALPDRDGFGPLARQIGAALLTASVDLAPRTGVLDARPAPHLSRTVDRALSFIRANARNPVHVDDIADAAGTSAGNLRRLFQAELQRSPMEMLWSERVKSGIRLLQSTGLSMAEIAALSGFKSPFHFSRRVKQQTGLSPGALRRRHWEQGGGG